MKNRAKMTVTLSMLWIGIMALTATPKWIREVRDFISSVTGHVPTPSPNAGPVASANLGGSRTGRAGGST